MRTTSHLRDKRRRQRRRALLVSAVLLCPGPVLARPPEVAAELGPALRIGEVPYKVLGWSVFDAELWASQDRFAWDRPFALSLTYRRRIPADALVSRSLRGMAERGAAAAPERLAPRLRACFPDVAAGDRITGVSLGSDRARFYLNGRRTCDLAWPGLRHGFFGIWLDAAGRDRSFSARLTGAPHPEPQG